jgi:hypothetical protein
METLKICLFSIGAAIFYGLLHDQITARICVEYFSIAHPTILPLTSPTALALEWGILATWWVGAALGILLSIAARLGKRPPVAARALIRPVAILLIAMAASSFLAGVTGFFLARIHVISLVGWLGAVIPQSKHARFMADWWAHSASYLVGILGGLILSYMTFVKRKIII